MQKWNEDGKRWAHDTSTHEPRRQFNETSGKPYVSLRNQPLTARKTFLLTKNLVLGYHLESNLL
jgi:hypothetical protein